jgi:hypothetical protein
LTNLVAKENGNGFDYYLVKYSSPQFELWKTAIANREYSDVPVTIENISLDGYSNSARGSCFDFAYSCPSGQHNSISKLGFCIFPPYEWTATTYAVPCDEGGGGGGGGGHGGPNPPPAPDPYTEPIIPTLSPAIPVFIANLLPAQADWWNSANNDIKRDIVNYLNQNIKTGVIRLEAKLFINQLIQQSILNPTLNFDVEASAKSPANIDRSAIDNNTPEGQKFNEIYDELKKAPQFKALFIDIFNSDGTRPNVKFIIEEHVYAGDDPQNPEVNAITDGTNPNFYLIKINKQCLIPNTARTQADIEVAKTIAHEAIHAYLYFKISNPEEAINIPGFENMDLPDLLNELKDVELDQHNFIFDNLAPKLGAILSSLKDVLTTPAQRAIVENMPMYAVANPQSVPITWNWNTYFTYLSYQGMEQSEGFKALFPAGSNALYIYNQYMAIGHNNL